ncbi:hypothetical protein [Nostoc sp. NMS4]|uniref:hypothetical protein n=1 Tax=Nostoc sp. NMS4 TaxID=2815390 RepID=UPI0025FBCFB1|nr:hypothetical protein [Nostoc sp. NMS4]MBN3928020.1 hypothetical protein [Nostoc sp. NMS4]
MMKSYRYNYLVSITSSLLVLVFLVFLCSSSAIAGPIDIFWKIVAYFGDSLMYTGVGELIEKVGDILATMIFHANPSIVQVIIDPNNPLQGVYPGNFKIIAQINNSMKECAITRPLMFRDSVNSFDWQLSSSARYLLDSCIKS